MRSKFKWIFALLLAFSVQVTFAQEKTVTGTVKDVSGALPGATIAVKGGTTVTTTDFDGNYSIKVKEGQSLTFSYAGFQAQTIVVGASSKIDVVMSETLLETVVIFNNGYRNIAAKKTAVSVASLSATAVEDRANANAIQNLQGQIAGLNISTGSGQPGSEPVILLRGPNSILGETAPLIIVDGIPVEGSFRTVNSLDIEKYEVLKDASATAIYGNRGANGVIIITTKKAKFGQKMQVRYQASYGVTELQGLNIPLMNSRQILSFQKQYGEGYGAGLSDAEIDAIAKQTNTNWTDYLFRIGTTMTHNVSISSGTEKTSNTTTLNYFDQDGIFLNTDLKRFSVRNNFTGRSANDKFNYGLNLSISYSKQNGMDGAGSNAIYFAPFSAALRGLPYLSPFDADGSVTSDGGIITRDPVTGLGIGGGITPDKIPYVLLNSAKMNLDREDELKILASFNASYKLTKDLTAGIRIGVDFGDYTNHEITHPNSILGPFQTSSALAYGGIDQVSAARDLRFNNVTSLNYTKVFGKHTFDVTGYTEYYKAHTDNIGFTKRGLDPRLVGTSAGYISPLTNPITAQYVPTVTSTNAKEGLFSYFGDFQYDYDNKYIFTATIRRDASFRFIEDYAWGTFGSVGAAWNMDEENFINKDIISQLKVRASYGKTGNQFIGGGAYSALNFTRSLYSAAGGYNGAPGTAPSVIGNVDLRWEVVTQADFGVDFGFWKNKLTGAIELYHKKTTDLYNVKPISNINGTSQINANVGSLENKGIEATLNYRIYDKNDWNIAIGANFSYNKNKLLALDPSFNGNFNQGGSTALIEGEPINVYYIVRYAGVNPANGNPLFLTKDGDLTETLSTDDRISTGKTVLPIWQGGFNTNISYKGFEFTTQWSWMADLWRNNLDLGTVEETGVGTINDGGNRATTLLNAWQNPGDITTIPRVNGVFNSIDFINSTDRYLEDASFLRLRNVSLGYKFKQDMLKKTPFTDLKFYVQAENLVTFTTYRGWDAEAGFRGTDRGNYPTPRIYTFGVSVNF